MSRPPTPRTRFCALLPILFLLPTVLAADAGPRSATAGLQERRANDGQMLLEGVPEVPEDLAARLRPYQNVRSASFQAWKEDGSGLYVTTRFGQVSQVHAVDMPGGARRQLTFFDEPVRQVERQPDGRLLAFTSDVGGGEFFQIFVFDPATGEVRRLTDGTSRNGGPRWSPDGTRLAFQSTRRNGRSNDVWVVDVDDPSSARMVVEAPDGTGWFPVDWSADGRRLLVEQLVSVADLRVHLLDLETGCLRRLAGSEVEPSANIAEGFDAEDQGIYLRTDAGGDVLRLAHLDLESGERTILTPDLAWDVDDFELAEDGLRAAFVVNEDGISRLYLMDPASARFRRVDSLPVGLVGGLTFDPGGERLAMTLNTPQTPSDVFTLALGRAVLGGLDETAFGKAALEAGELVRWTRSEVGGLDTDAFVVPELVRYPTFDTVDGAPRQIPAFVYKPAGPGPHPVIVVIHGGPEGQARPAFSDSVQLWIAELGAAVVVPNVRGSAGYGRDYLALDNGFRREDSVKDIGALLDWIAGQPDLDAGRVAVYGGSYGGYMVLASLVHYSDRLRAGVDVVGISNFVTFLENTQDYRRDLRRVEYGDERDPEMRAFLERISPNRHAAKITTPLLVAQGQNDPRVPVTESEQIVREMRTAGNEVWYLRAENEGHGFRKKENRDLFDEVVMLFLAEHLRGEG